MDGQHANLAAIAAAMIGLMQFSCAPPDLDGDFEHPPESTYAVSTSQLQHRDTIAEVHVAHVTAEFFAVLDRPLWLGRTFFPQDFMVRAEPVAILSHRLWDQKLDGRPQIIGRTLQVDEQSYMVIGVMPPGIEWPPGVEFWIPQISEVP